MKARPITAYDDAGNPVATYPSLTAAAADRGVSASNILQSMTLGTRSAGLRWAYDELPTPARRPAHGYVTYDERGEVAGRYASQREAAAALGVSPGSVSQALRTGGVTSARNLRVRRPLDAAPGPLVVKRVVAYDDAGEVVATFETQADAARALGEQLTALHHALHGGYRMRQGVRVQFEGQAAPGPYVNAALRATSAYDDAGRLVGTYASRTEAARALGLSTASLAQAMTLGGRLKGLRFRDAGEPAPGAYAGQGARAVESVSDAGVVTRYATQGEAGAAVGVTQAAISYALRAGTRCAGLRWRFAEAGAAPAPAAQAAPAAPRARRRRP